VFRTAPVVEPAPDVKVPAELISLVELELSLDMPAGGWSLYFAGRGIEVLTDDLGRPAITRSDARLLFDEHSANELRKAEFRAASEKAAEEADRQFRASLRRGVPASALPAGLTYGQAVAEAELNAHPYRPRASVVEDLLDNGGGGYVFHPITQPADEE
jgi:hypothetical protein